MKFGTGAKIEYFFQTTKQLSKKCKKMLGDTRKGCIFATLLIQLLFKNNN